MAEQISYHTDKYGNRPIINCFRSTPSRMYADYVGLWTAWVVMTMAAGCNKYEVVLDCNARPFIKFKVPHQSLPIFHAAIIARIDNQIIGITFFDETVSAEKMLAASHLRNMYEVISHNLGEKPESSTDSDYINSDSMILFSPVFPDRHTYYSFQKLQLLVKSLPKEYGDIGANGWYQLDTAEVKYFIHFDCCIREHSSNMVMLIERANEFQE